MQHQMYFVYYIVIFVIILCQEKKGYNVIKKEARFQ